jgi:hypothetical protein
MTTTTEPAATEAQTTSQGYVVHFTRIGRDRNVPPLIAESVDGPNHLAELIHNYARPRLISRDVEVSLDLATGSGQIFAGLNNGESCTIHGLDDAVPFVHTDLGVMPGYVAGWCGHRVAESEWRAGFRVCERCPDPRAIANCAEEQPEPTDELLCYCPNNSEQCLHCNGHEHA